ncbi:D-alanyl-D-alanine serine-type carboxypeptidase [Roseomonas mucosa]|uniref:D-alanyl-D-alanine carboxypeptidase dacA n=1 Tax=Roseomonas mucosa TaxID=207340 RepID=A0A379N2A3_9PROT|nr:D-alanyl-D-alanine serine-type carboxypeptidase [Roseomonas mucosa]MBS5904820.1 D-alanyl-D-alanine carboxypeptidase [Acetobacteraceae bacterium]QDD94635.1 D-alanyl-D-alanine serine-type carboxypeptidase [Roseomonas mucosa]QDD99744.1 D-alanyl-D-alanine serine-type carboxypeptidase [Roseomonas mucosa]QDJ09457.1 D-alanyl-D-alanine serine-type carboxypeptidase [Roseomonas mucosa]
MSLGWRTPRRVRCLALAFALVSGWGATILGIVPAAAQIGSDRYASIVIDARSGQALSAANADEPRYPASLTKMMTLYLLFEALRDGRMTLDSRMVMSAEAASQSPSKLGIPPGSSISVEQAILALVTLSANDVAWMIGETLGGSNDRFAQMMTQKARQIGMTNTVFRNANGLPDFQQVTTARDMAALGRRLYIDFPNRYHYFSTPEFRYGGRRVRSHNRMIGTYEGVDGIKTGFISASGFNIVTSAQRQGQRLVVAVFGGSTWVERDRHAAALLDDGFAKLGIEPSTPSALLVASAGAGAARAAGGLITGRAHAATVSGRAAMRAARQARLAAVEPVRRDPPAKLVRTSAQIRPLRPITRNAKILEQGDGGAFIRTAKPQAARGRAATPVAVRAPAKPAPAPARAAHAGAKQREARR